MARKIRTRTPNITYLILVEGETEKIYFRSLKEYHLRHGFTIEIRKPAHGNPAPLVKDALREQAGGVYNFIWCVYDCDVFRHDNMVPFQKIYERAVQKGIQFAESMPSIEVWFILHYDRPQKSYQGKDAVLNHLRQYIHGYCKEQDWQEKHLYMNLETRQNEALDRVKDFALTSHNRADTATSVHNLVEIFIAGASGDKTV